LCDRGLGYKKKQKVLYQDELTEEQLFEACLLTGVCLKTFLPCCFSGHFKVI
jgi:hypothetical protein